ncbi:post-GPI attachment to proteins factor 2-like [Apostichopus japonicus]|uniref:post-GPI attachment to proteins factor 2-like n=1 Tax=Stichopus japonicus TaxID=307972 RepID=UPI003AB3CCE4
MMTKKSSRDPFEMTDDVVYIPFRGATIVSSIIVSGGFVLCIILALVYHFERTTWTHCQVPNYLPSISAAISVPPSAYIWRLVVASCASQRLCTVVFHHKHYSNIFVPNSYYRRLCKLCFGSEFLENLCLIGLTCISSTENHGLHAMFFIGFQLFAVIFMFLMCIVYSMATMSEDNSNTKSLKWKWGAFLTNVAAFVLAMGSYYLHNAYCRPGVYTVFAFFEYIIVLSNIAYHVRVSLDFSDREIRFGVRQSNKNSCR